MTIASSGKPDTNVRLDFASFHHWKHPQVRYQDGHNELDEPAISLAVLALAMLPSDLFQLVSEHGLIVGGLTGTYYTHHSQHPLILLPQYLLPDKTGKGLIRASQDEMREYIARGVKLHPVGVFEDSRTAP